MQCARRLPWRSCGRRARAALGRGRPAAPCRGSLPAALCRQVVTPTKARVGARVGAIPSDEPTSRGFALSALPSRSVTSVRFEPELQATPLAEREPRYRIELAELRRWESDAAAQGAAVFSGSAAGNSDDPTPSELQVELTWLVEDAIAGLHNSDGGVVSMPWRQLQRELAASGKGEGVQLASRADLDQLRAIWKQRVQERVPIQYLLGSCHWRDLVLAVGPGCLIPRPETELMVDFAEEVLAAARREGRALAGAPWVDLGTGSGALAVALGRMLPAGEEVRVWAVDTSPEAARWAALNVEREQLGGTVRVVVGSWYEPVGALRGQVGGILSNPPYIPRWKLEGLQAEVGRHEPSLALDGGEGDGLDSVRCVTAGAAEMLLPGGFLALETEGGHQTQVIAAMLADTGAFEDIRIRADLRGVDRFVTCHRSSS